MASPDRPASPEVEKHATEAARLDPLALIGVFGTDAKPGALIRLPSGSFKRVEIGDKVAQNKVVAIDAQSVVLENAGRNRRLRLPAT